jgi:hypothetical protein
VVEEKERRAAEPAARVVENLTLNDEVGGVVKGGVSRLDWEIYSVGEVVIVAKKMGTQAVLLAGSEDRACVYACVGPPRQWNLLKSREE